MTSNQQGPYPGFQPYVQPYAQPPQYPQEPQVSPYPQQPPPPYTQQPAGFLQQPASYPQQPASYPEQPPGYPQQPPPGFPGAQNMGYVNTPYGPTLPPPPPRQFPTIDETSEDGKELTGTWTGFSDKAIRQAFIRKVYAILMLQLTFSLAVIAVFIFVDKVKRFVRQNMYIYTISYVTFFAVYIALLCCGNLRRKWPTNIILLSIFTMCMSYMLGTISSFHDTKIVIMAVGICAACCLAVSIFSFYTKFDFTTCGGALCILLFVFFIFGIIAAATFSFYPVMQTIYAALGALLFVMFLAYDTQQIMGGKKHELSAEEHITAAMLLYIDVVYIFLFILMLAGSKK